MHCLNFGQLPPYHQIQVYVDFEEYIASLHVDTKGPFQLSAAYILRYN